MLGWARFVAMRDQGTSIAAGLGTPTTPTMPASRKAFQRSSFVW